MNLWRRFLIAMFGIYWTLSGLRQMQKGVMVFETRNYRFTVFSVAEVLSGLFIVTIALLPKSVYARILGQAQPEEKHKAEVHPYYHRHQHPPPPPKPPTQL